MAIRIPRPHPDEYHPRFHAEISGVPDANDFGELLRQQARDTGIGSGIPDFIGNLFTRAIGEGYGNEDVVALIRVLRSAASPEEAPK